MQKEGLDVPYRFGKGFDVDINLADGEWTKAQGGRIWSMRFQSLGAYSINFVFEKLKLSKGASLYISNDSETVLYGPVTYHENTPNGYFLTDLIQGEDVTINLFEPELQIGKSSLEITKVVHGYKDIFSSMKNGNLNGSESCNNDIACFQNWSNESDAVALVLLADGTELCSGSLIMTANQSFRPYFLSAFHCIDLYEDGILSQDEINKSMNWMFKFQYKKSTCNGSNTKYSITYNGAQFRAAWNNTDFALMEMNNSPAGRTDFAWLGWDRSGIAPTSGTTIHHPAGDVMKISFENNSFEQSSWGGINNHWLVNFDNGVVQHGSSGSPILNQERRVVGNLHGNQLYNQNNTYCSQPRAEYGRFDISWTGGGTNTTRLSNWLDPSNSGIMTTNTARSPFLVGPSAICSQATYIVKNLAQGATIYWDIHPELTIISQTDSSVTVQKSTFAPLLHNAYVRADVEDPMYFDFLTLEKFNIVVWQSGTIETNSLISAGGGLHSWGGEVEIPFEFLNAGAHDVKWSASNFWTPSMQGANFTQFFGAEASGDVYITVEFKNPCGQLTTIYRKFTFPASQGYYKVSPNPSSTFININPSAENTTGRSTQTALPVFDRVVITDAMGNVKLQQTVSKTSAYRIDVSRLPNGIYYLNLYHAGKLIEKKTIQIQK